MLSYSLSSCLLLIFVSSAFIWRSRNRQRFPIVGSPNDQNVANAVLEGYSKYPDSPFMIRSHPPRLILPKSLFKEAMRAPESHLNFMLSIYNNFQGRYTRIGTEIHDLIFTVRSDLTKNISSILGLLQDETVYGMKEEIGACKEWMPVPIYPKLLRIVALLGNRVFVGLPLSRDERWMSITINYTVHVAELTHAARRWNSFVRPWVLPFLPETKQVIKDIEIAQTFVRPLVQEAVKDEKEGKVPARAGTRGSFISWMLKNQDQGQKNAERAGINQMILSFVALHTTSITAAFVLLDLASRPEYVQPLREEIEKVIHEDGWQIDELGLRHLTKSSFQKMSKLDSFIKESQRVNPINLVEAWRTVVSDFTFSNGLKVPKGTSLAWPVWAIHKSDETPVLSPSYNEKAGNPGPEVFDGFRFSKLRGMHGAGGQKHSTVTTSEDSLNFGHGPHACPGRFFAIFEIKSILVNMILQYDIRIAATTGRYNVMSDINNSPTLDAVVELRER